MQQLIQPRHDPELVVLSVVIACVASYAALFLAGHVAFARARFAWLCGGAAAMGIGIWSMHFIAMLAYQLPVSVGYDLPTVGLSLLIAVGASTMGLAVAGRRNPPARQIVLTGPAMGLAIAGMHYVGMASMRLPARAHYDAWLVLASIGIAVAASYAAIVLFLRFRNDCTSRRTWSKILSAVVMGHAVAGMHYTAMAAVHFEHAQVAVRGTVLPPGQLASALAIATVVVLALIIAGAMLDRWAETGKQIRQSEERFRAMVDAMHDYAIFTVDAEGRINSWNRGGERLYGYAASDVIGQHLRILFPKDAQEEAERHLRIAAEHGRHEADGLRVSKDGSALHVNVTTSAMHDGHGQLLGFTRVTRDITERLRAHEELVRHEQQLRQAQKMEAVGQLAGGVAHDFNNMLTAIRGYADILRADCASLPETEPGFDEIAKAVDRASALTRQLLAFSRKQVLQPQPVKPNTAVLDIESMLRRLLVGDVELVTELDAETGQITVDPAQLQQVLLNLTLNARDAMPKGGRIVIRTANVTIDEAFCRDNPGMVPGPHVMLSVSDEGVGIRPDVLPHIFEPFFTTKQIGAGTGLGLSMVYGIVKQSGGYIRVDSEPEVGSTFTAYFPRTTEPCPDMAAPAAAAPPRPSGATILLVDDEESVRKMLASLLGRHGFELLIASDGVEALAMARAHSGPIDLLVTDMLMPRMHGRELSQRLRETRPDTRVLFMSGYTSNDIIDRGLLDARMAFIQKPFDVNDLMSKIRSTLNGPAALPWRAAIA